MSPRRAAPEVPGFDRRAFNREVGLRINLVRTIRRQTQAEIAKAAYLSRPALANIEAGRQSIAADQLWRLAIVLKVTVARLLPERVP